MAEPRVHLGAISHLHGEPRPLSEAAGLTEAAYTLLKDDIDSFRESDLATWELAVRVARSTLDRADGRPDLLLYVAQGEPDPGAALLRLARELDLPEVDSLALTGHDCGNFAPSLGSAADAVLSGRKRRVLLVLADRALPGQRGMPSGLSVFSDGAVACLVTRDRPADGGFLVDAVVNRVSVRPEQAPADQGILATVLLAREGTEAVLRETGSAREDFARVLLPNYRIDSQRFLAQAMGFPEDRLLFGRVRSYGHCFSADVLITLGEQSAAGALPVGERLLAAGSGPHSWSSVALTCE